MYCGTYNITFTAINKTGDSTFTVPLPSLTVSTVDKLNLYQTITFTIDDAYWPFYDNSFTDFYTFEFTWFTAPFNRHYGIATNS